MATYYVSNSGNNDSDGLSEQTAWQTLSKVANYTFSAGDFIRLKCGDVWREQLLVHDSGTAEAQITYTKYGTGPNPLIYGSALVTSWTNQGGNIWRSVNTFAVNPYSNGGVGAGNVWPVTLDGNILHGIYKTTTGELTGDLMWAYSFTYIYMYSTSDPGTRFSKVEVQTKQFSIGLQHKEYITIDGIDVFFNGTCIYEGYITWGLTGLIIRNCELAYSGYPNGNSSGVLFCYNNSLIENNIIHDHGRRGISLTNVLSTLLISNITIRNNTFYHGFHTTSVDLQLSGGYSGSMSNVYIYGNTIYDDVDRVAPYYPMQMFISDQGAPGTITNVRVFNNTFKGTTGAAINMSGVEDIKVWNNTFYKFNEITTADRCFLWIEQGTIADIKNNIFYSQINSATNYKGNIITAGTNCTISSDYNCVYRTSLSYTAYRIVGGSNYNLTNKVANTSALGWDANSIYTNPLVSDTSLRLQQDSPCIRTGVDVGLPYYKISPCIGAFEFQDGITYIKIGNRALTYKDAIVIIEDENL